MGLSSIHFSTSKIQKEIDKVKHMSTEYIFGDINEHDETDCITIYPSNSSDLIAITKDSWSRILNIDFVPDRGEENSFDRERKTYYYRPPFAGFHVSYQSSRYMLVMSQQSIQLTFSEAPGTVSLLDKCSVQVAEGCEIKKIKYSLSKTSLCSGISIVIDDGNVPEDNSRTSTSLDLVSVNLNEMSETDMETGDSDTHPESTVSSVDERYESLLESISDDQFLYIQLILVAICVALISLGTFWAMDRNNKDK